MPLGSSGMGPEAVPMSDSRSVIAKVRRAVTDVSQRIQYAPDVKVKVDDGPNSKGLTLKGESASGGR